MSSARDRLLSPCRSLLRRASHRLPALQPAAALLVARRLSLCDRKFRVLSEGTLRASYPSSTRPTLEVRYAQRPKRFTQRARPTGQWSAVGVFGWPATRTRGLVHPPMCCLLGRVLGPSRLHYASTVPDVFWTNTICIALYGGPLRHLGAAYDRSAAEDETGLNV